MTRIKTALLLGAALVASVTACDAPRPDAPPSKEAQPAPERPRAPMDFPPVEPPTPGAPGGLPDDGTPLSEAPFTPESAQGAADVVQTYFALIGEKKYAEAYARLRNPPQTLVQFAQGFDRYHQFNANVGAPGTIEGAAGSLYVDVPVLIYGRLKTGEVVNDLGTATLRRVNGVPGATPEQLVWRIEKLETKPTEAGGVANG